MAGKEKFPDWDRNPRPPVPMPPPMSCDCQVHVYEDQARYPVRWNIQHEIPDGPFSEAQRVLKVLGFQRMVLVHPSVYDTDYSMLKDIMRGLPDRSNYKGVVVIKDHVADSELEELAEIYEERGLNKDLAKQVAIALTEHDALGAHLREELGHHEASKARPLQAALTSAAAFTAGGVIPFFGLFFTGAMRGPAITVISVLGLFIAGYLSARAAGCGILRPTMRVVIGGSLAMAVTFVVGTLFGGVA